MRTITTTLLLVLGGVAQGEPLLWQLTDVTLSDGQTVSGSFVFDRDTNVFSDIAITNSGTTGHPAAVWDTLLPRLPRTDPRYAWTGSPSDWGRLWVTPGPPELSSRVLLLDWIGSLEQWGEPHPFRDPDNAAAPGPILFHVCAFDPAPFNDGPLGTTQFCDGTENQIKGVPPFARYNSGSLIPLPTPIPGGLWLLATGLGLVSLKRLWRPSRRAARQMER